jgi:hypothetical protein
MEGLLAGQAIAQNALFTDLARRARTSTTLDRFERYLRLAFKAQNQCRATIETLATIKNPPTVFARQANIAHGPQQVNNGVAPTGHISAPARAENRQIEQTKQLEPANGERMDGGTADAASGGDPALAPVGTVDGPALTCGKSPIGQERGPRRRVAERARAARLATSVAPRRA